MYEIRDPIHRTINFSEREKRVIDHPFVQRLRQVRQLGLSYTVYPGATHDRFSHALGAMHVAGRMWARMVETSGEVLRQHFSEDDLSYFRQILRFSGLMHDLGHPPFSHVSEKFMPAFDALDMPREWLITPKQDRQASHEDYSVLLIAALAADDAAPLSRDEAQDIASLVHHGVMPSPAWQKRFGEQEGSKGIHRLLRSLISGELDCDRMDYLLRDAYYTGVAYGTHDIEHLIANLGVVEMPDRGLVRTIDSTAVRAFEDFLLARYHMFLQVYLHKTTLSFDHFLEQAIAEGEFELKVPGDAKGYARLRDSTMIERMFTAAEDERNVWSRRLVNRQPGKLIYKSTNGVPSEKALMDEVIGALKDAGVPYFEVTSHQYLSKSLPSVEGAGGPSSMLVRRKMFGKYVYEPIEKFSALLTKYNESIDMTHLFVLPEHYASAKAAIARFSQ
ncbi:MAG TPA: HD domain-containing protein [Candidatus Binatia bacterium]|nr:HD domain-containing protein [Candidatus Binatia bacterium]